MANGYQHRIEALEERLGVGQCGDEPCLKCQIARYRAEQRGVDWSGCDKRPVDMESLDRLTDEELVDWIATLREMAGVNGR